MSNDAIAKRLGSVATDLSEIADDLDDQQPVHRNKRQMRSDGGAAVTHRRPDPMDDPGYRHTTSQLAFVAGGVGLMYAGSALADLSIMAGLAATVASGAAIAYGIRLRTRGGAA